MPFSGGPGGKSGMLRLANGLMLESGFMALDWLTIHFKFKPIGSREKHFMGKKMAMTDLPDPIIAAFED